MFLSEILNIFKKIFSPEFLFRAQIAPQNLRLILIIAIAVLILAILIKVFAFLKFKEDKVRQKLYGRIFAWFATIAILGIFFLFCGWQQIGFLAMPFWLIFLGLLFLIWGIIILIYRVRKFPTELTDFEYQKRKARYLPKPKTRR